MKRAKKGPIKVGGKGGQAVEKPKVMAWRQANEIKREDNILVFDYGTFNDAIWEEFASVAKVNPRLVYSSTIPALERQKTGGGRTETAMDLFFGVFLGVAVLGCGVSLCLILRPK